MRDRRVVAARLVRSANLHRILRFAHSVVFCLGTDRENQGANLRLLFFVQGKQCHQSAEEQMRRQAQVARPHGRASHHTVDPWFGRRLKLRQRRQFHRVGFHADDTLADFSD